MKSSEKSTNSKPILFIDINQANEEYDAIVKHNAGRRVIRIPDLRSIKNFDLQSLLAKKINADGARFSACQSPNAQLCQIATQRSRDSEAMLSKYSWNLLSEIQQQMSLIDTEIGTIYISGHYDLANNQFGRGAILGKWGALNLKSISDLMLKNKYFRNTQLMTLLSCYFAQDGLVQSIFPIANQKPIYIFGYKGSGPLSKNPESEKYIQLFSDIDNSFVQPRKYHSKESVDDFSQILNKKKSREIHFYKSNGAGQILRISSSNAASVLNENFKYKKYVYSEFNTKYEIHEQTQIALKKIFEEVESLQSDKQLTQVKALIETSILNLHEMFKIKTSYDFTSSWIRDLLYLKTIQESIQTGFVVETQDIDLVTSIENEYLFQKTNYYKQNSQERIRELDSILNRTYDGKESLQNFKEFGLTLQEIRIRIQYEKTALSQL